MSHTGVTLGGAKASCTDLVNYCSQSFVLEACPATCGICPVNGGWGSWSSCSVECGLGTHTRECNAPAPEEGGQPCEGEESKDCNLKECEAPQPPPSTANTCSCANGGTAATGDACTTDNANICTACTGDFYLDGSSCDAWASDCVVGQTETQTPSNTQDRVCAANTCTCVNGNAATGFDCTTNNADICASCDAGYTQNGNYCNGPCDGYTETTELSECKKCQEQEFKFANCNNLGDCEVRECVDANTCDNCGTLSGRAASTCEKKKSRCEKSANRCKRKNLQKTRKCKKKCREANKTTREAKEACSMFLQN